MTLPLSLITLIEPSSPPVATTCPDSIGIGQTWKFVLVLHRTVLYIPCSSCKDRQSPTEPDRARQSPTETDWYIIISLERYLPWKKKKGLPLRCPVFFYPFASKYCEHLAAWFVCWLTTSFLNLFFPSRDYLQRGRHRLRKPPRNKQKKNGGRGGGMWMFSWCTE